MARALRPRRHPRRGQLRRLTRRRRAPAPLPLRRPVDAAHRRRPVLERAVRGQHHRRVGPRPRRPPCAFFIDGRRRLGRLSREQPSVEVVVGVDRRRTLAGQRHHGVGRLELQLGQGVGGEPPRPRRSRATTGRTSPELGAATPVGPGRRRRPAGARRRRPRPARRPARWRGRPPRTPRAGRRRPGPRPACSRPPGTPHRCRYDWRTSRRWPSGRSMTQMAPTVNLRGDQAHDPAPRQRRAATGRRAGATGGAWHAVGNRSAHGVSLRSGGRRPAPPSSSGVAAATGVRRSACSSVTRSRPSRSTTDGTGLLAHEQAAEVVPRAVGVPRAVDVAVDHAAGHRAQVEGAGAERPELLPAQAVRRVARQADDRLAQHGGARRARGPRRRRSPRRRGRPRSACPTPG